MEKDEQVASLTEEDKGDSEGEVLPQYIVAITAMLIVFAGGTAAGWTSPALPMLMATNSTMNMTVDEASWVGSLMPVGALIGAVPAGTVADIVGRKKLLLIMGAPYILSWLLIAVANSVYLLYIARFVLGLGLGAAGAIGNVYISEIAESRVRGVLGSYYQLMFVGGILYVYVLGAFCSFRVLALMCGLIPVLFVASFFRAPESPVYLLRQNRKREAHQAVRRVRGFKYNVYRELNALQKEIDAQASARTPFLEAACRKASVRALVISAGLMAGQQLSGVNVVIFYADKIFVDAGSTLAPSVAVIVMGVAQVVACYVSGLLMDKAGRRVLLMVSGVVMALCLGALGHYFRTKEQGADVSRIGTVPLVALVCYIVFFCAGFGPVPWAVAGEILPPEIKGVSVGLVTAFNWILAFLVTKTFQSMLGAVGAAVTFWGFGAVCLLSAVFVYFVVIETKGKSLREIQDVLEGRPSSPA